MRRLLAFFALLAVLATPLKADLYNDLLFLNQMNESSCIGQGGSWSGMMCSSSSSSSRLRLSVEEQARIDARRVAYREARPVIRRALQNPLDNTRFVRRYPDIALPEETPESARMFECLRQRIAGVLLAERASDAYDRMIRASGTSFHFARNARDIYYWTQDIVAVRRNQPRFLLDLRDATHRQLMIDLVLQEAPRAWQDAQARAAAHDPDLVIDTWGKAKPAWFLTDIGLTYRLFENDEPRVRVGRSFFAPASCRNHYNATRTKLIPASGYFMDERVKDFVNAPSTVRLEGILPFSFPN